MLSPDRPIVILSGAGISKESGLSTFRDSDGLWAKYRVEDVATPEAFARDPVSVHDFYNLRRRFMAEQDIAPNKAHEALAELEASWPGGVVLITQNIDDLHERAGSKNLIHMHGRYNQSLCNHCRAVTDWQGDMSVEDECVSCRRAGGLRPNVVWFGEMPLEMERIEAELRSCGLFISIGTSGNVYPAAGFVSLVRAMGDARTVELNLLPSNGASQFEQSVYGPATQVVPRYIQYLLSPGL